MDAITISRDITARKTNRIGINGIVDLHFLNLGNALLYYIFAIAGFFSVYYTSIFIQKRTCILKCSLMKMGEVTLFVMCTHLLIFVKLANIISSMIFHVSHIANYIFSIMLVIVCETVLIWLIRKVERKFNIILIR